MAQERVQTPVDQAPVDNYKQNGIDLAKLQTQPGLEAQYSAGEFVTKNRSRSSDFIYSGDTRANGRRTLFNSPHGWGSAPFGPSTQLVWTQLVWTQLVWTQLRSISGQRCNLEPSWNYVSAL